MQIVTVRGQRRVYSWANGFKTVGKKKLGLDQEARRNPAAVINRLIRSGEYEEAERIMDHYMQ